MAKLILVRGIPGSGKSRLALDLLYYYQYDNEKSNRDSAASIGASSAVFNQPSFKMMFPDLVNKKFEPVPLKKFHHYEADQYFIDEQGNYNFDASKLYYAHKWCQDKTREGLEHGDTVIVSNTFTTIKELKPYFNLAKEFGIVPVVYLAQNQFPNVHGVPFEKLKQMRDRFQYDISELFV
jgi:predicted kinase